LKKEARISDLQEEVESNSLSINGLKMKVEAQCEELRAKTTKIASLEVDILTKKMQVSCLQSTNESQTEEIVKLKHTIEFFEDKVSCLDADISDKSRNIARLKCKDKMISQDVEHKTAQVLSLTSEVKKRTDWIAYLEVEHKMEKSLRDEEKSKEHEALSAEINSWKDFLKVRDSKLDTLRTEARRGEKEIIDQANRIIDLEKDIQLKDVLISTLEMQEKNVLRNDNGIKSETTDDILSLN